jgi:hypothetical protein
MKGEDDKPIEIRPYQERDRPEVAAICLEAGGRGGSYRDWLDVGQELFLDLWLNYFLDHEKDLAFVAARGDEIVGYLVGCRSVREKDRVFLRRYVPTIAVNVLRGRYRVHRGVFRFFGRVIHDFLCYGWPTIDETRFPSEIHVNVKAGQPQFHWIVAHLARDFLMKATQEKIEGVQGMMALDREKLKIPSYQGFVIHDARPTSIFGGGDKVLARVGCVLPMVLGDDARPPHGSTGIPVRRRCWHDWLARARGRQEG